MTLRELGEFGLIRRIPPQFSQPDGVLRGMGDDCAVLPLDEARVQGITADLLLENTHFQRDRIAVTGDLGDSAVGLRLLLAGDTVGSGGHEQRRIEAHYRPRPHLEEGQWLARREAVHAMMDVSDGIDSDLRRILEQSGVGASVDLDALPLSGALRKVCAERGWSAVEFAAAGGEDYCLLCTVEPRAFSDLATVFDADFGRPLQAIRTVQKEEGCTYRFEGRPSPLVGHGFDHFTA